MDIFFSLIAAACAMILVPINMNQKNYTAAAFWACFMVFNLSIGIINRLGQLL